MQHFVPEGVGRYASDLLSASKDRGTVSDTLPIAGIPVVGGKRLPQSADDYILHERRRIVHFAVTAHPTGEWTAQQMREAFPWDTAPRYLLRDRDRIFGHDFVKQVKAMGIKQVLSAPRSPWQRAYVERVIGTIRRECLDHLIVFNDGGLDRQLRTFVEYYHRNRVHLALEKDTPESRPVQPESGRIVSIPVLGRLHHRYERRAA